MMDIRFRFESRIGGAGNAAPVFVVQRRWDTEIRNAVWIIPIGLYDVVYALAQLSLAILLGSSPFIRPDA